MLLTDLATGRKHIFSTVVHTAWARLSPGLLLGALMAVGACGDDTKPRDSSSLHRDSATTAFRVALLTPGPISDQAWNGGAYQGLLRIRDSLGASISHIQTKTPAEFEEQFR